MKKFKTSLVLIGIGIMNFLHAALHLLQFIQSIILVKASTNNHTHHHHDDSFLESLLHNPYFAILWAIVGISTLWIGIKDYKHHNKCQDH